MTFYHHVEEVNNVNWRYFKKFEGEYLDKNNKKTTTEYSIFVRKLNMNVETHVNPAGELMWKEGIYKGSRPFVGSGLRVLNSKDMFEFIANIIKKNKAKGLIYTSN